MARPKEKASPWKVSGSLSQGMSEAFTNKSHQEQQKLQLLVAKTLGQDLLSVFEEEEHIDLIVSNGSCEVPAHHCIMQARAKHLWQESWVHYSTNARGHQTKVIHVNDLSEKQIKDFLRQLYCVTDSELLFEEFLPYFQPESCNLEEAPKTVPTLSTEGDADCQEYKNHEIEAVDVKKNIASVQGIVPTLSTEGDADCQEYKNHEIEAVDVKKNVASVQGILPTLSTEGVADCQEYKNHETETVDVKKNVASVQGTGIPSEREQLEGGKLFPNSYLSDGGGASETTELVENGISNDEVGLGSPLRENATKESILKHISSGHIVNEIFLMDDLSSENSRSPKGMDGCGCDIGVNVAKVDANIERDIVENLCSSSSSGHDVRQESNETELVSQDVKIIALECECLPQDEFLFPRQEVPSSEGNISTVHDSAETAIEERGDHCPRVLVAAQTSTNGMSPSSATTVDCHLSQSHTPKDVRNVKESVPHDQNVSPLKTDDKDGGKTSAESEGEDTGDKSIETDASQSQKSKFPGSAVVHPYNTCSSLGQDLIQLYLQQIHCDCCLSVEGVEFLAHRCILSARSPYFSAMFGGQWSESSLEVIHLEGVSASAMEKILLFFYGGVIDDLSSDIVDVFVVADMYGADTLKLVLQFYMKKDMCHFFHKPCSTCIIRSPEALTLCNNFLLEELQERLLKWISKNFIKIWCTKSFANLSEALHQLCVKAVVNQMTETNVLDIIINCEKLTTSLPRIKWTESILCITTQLMDLAIEYTSANFIKVIHSPEFMTWAKVAAWKASALEEIFTSVIDSLPVDTAITVYQTLLGIKAQEDACESPDENFTELLEVMIQRCQKFLRTHILQVTRCKQWSTLNKSFQSQILENSSYVHLDQFPDPKPRPKKPIMYSTLSKPNRTSPSLSSKSSSSSSPSVSLQPKREGVAMVTQKRFPNGKFSSASSRDGKISEKTQTDTNVKSTKKSVTSSMLSKALKSCDNVTSTASKPKLKSSTEFASPNSIRANKAKTGKPIAEGLSQPRELSQSYKRRQEFSKPSGILSSSLPIGRESSGLGRSPPGSSSRIPVKTTEVRTQPNHQKSSSKLSEGIGLNECSNDLTLKVDATEQVANISDLNEINSDSAGSYDRLDPQASVSPQVNRAEAEGNGCENQTLPTPKSERQNLPDDSQETSIQEGESPTNGASFIQQETNFTNAQPVRISFITPSEADKGPL